MNKIRNHIWTIQPCSAVKGGWLINGIKWLSEQLVFKGKNNFPNNLSIVDDSENNQNSNKEGQSDNSHASITVNTDANLNNNKTSTNNMVGEINKIENNIKNDNANDNMTKYIENNINNDNNINNIDNSN